jgi:hypothetical protein
MYPFYNPQFVKFEHNERVAQLRPASRRTRPLKRLRG